MPRGNRCQERIDAKSEYMPRENRVEKSRVHFSCQAQYLVKVECHFSWQAQHFVKFWEIAGARNVVFSHTKCVFKMRSVRSPKRRVRDDDFMVGSCSDHGRIILESSFYWRKQFSDILNLEFRGRRSIW